MEPEVSVVIASHDRPLRLRWLLNALEEQTLEAARFEVVVVHDSFGAETQRLLDEHPLRAAGRLRDRGLAPGTGSPGRQRNLGWRTARAALIAFTDDDCRPERDWLERLLSAVADNPDSIVQGRTRPDPFETELLKAAHVRTIEVEPPGPYAQGCNILYPRSALEGAGGFMERIELASGEDTDLALRARELGFAYVGERGAVVNHAIEALSLPRALRVTRKWSDLAYVVKAHPQMRSRLTAGLFWRPSHLALIVAAIGLGAARRRGSAILAAGPYLYLRGPASPRPRSIVSALARLPGRIVLDAFELAVCARGSVRHRTPFL